MEKNKIMLGVESIQIYNDFRNKEGGSHISTPVTIQFLKNLCLAKKPKRILEMGGGIGTISYSLLKYSDAFVDIYEDNSFCQEQLKKNLAEFQGRFQIIESYRYLPPNNSYDLMIIDGGNGKPDESMGHDGGFLECVWHFAHYIRNLEDIYIEGYRFLQRQWLKKALRKKYIYKISKINNINLDGQILKGGTFMVCKKSRIFFLRWLNYIYWEILEWYPIKNFLKYRFNQIKKLIFK